MLALDLLCNTPCDVPAVIAQAGRGLQTPLVPKPDAHVNWCGPSVMARLQGTLDEQVCTAFFIIDWHTGFGYAAGLCHM